MWRVGDGSRDGLAKTRGFSNKILEVGTGVVNEGEDLDISGQETEEVTLFDLLFGLFIINVDKEGTVGFIS